MRALGPGSVSSFLKIVLDVVFAALWIGVAVLSLLTLAAVLLGANPGLLARLDAHVRIAGAGDVGALTRNGPAIAGGLLGAALYVGGVLVIVAALRRIFATLTAGDPFHPDNVARLRLVGLMLAALELGRYVFWIVGAGLFSGVHKVEPSLNLTGWFSVLVVFVLAEVFREGARLRREAELTI